MTATILILNGVGSAGKSSIARALQEIASEPFLHVAMDTFLDMMPPAYFDHPDGLIFETVTEDGHPSVAIRTGEVVERTLAGMRRAAAALAEAGNNLIIDEVLLGSGEARDDYLHLLASHHLRWIGVHAPLDVLEARERGRQDRLPGLARWQFGRVHAGMIYDFEIDTATATPQQAARAIAERFGI